MDLYPKIFLSSFKVPIDFTFLSHLKRNCYHSLRCIVYLIFSSPTSLLHYGPVMKIVPVKLPGLRELGRGELGGGAVRKEQGRGNDGIPAVNEAERERERKRERAATHVIIGAAHAE